MSNLELSEETAVVATTVFFDNKTITEINIEEDCQGIVGRLHETGDTKEIENAITNLNSVEAFAGKAKSKLIFGFSQWYKLTEPEGNFAEWFTQKFGGEKLTVQKHQAIGELLLDDEVPMEVKQLPSKELISVARAKQSGYDLTEHYGEIANAGSEAEVNAIVRGVKDKPERTGTLTIKVYADGTIMGFMGEGVTVNLGWLNYADRDSESREIFKKALEIGISRIQNNSRMKIEKE